MPPNGYLPSRRQAATGFAATAASLTLPARLFGQPATAEGWKILRAEEAGFNGAVPGPLLRGRRGDDFRVRTENALAKSTAIHWHGVRVPNLLDGVPFVTQQPIPPNTRLDANFIPPDAGTFWYHAAFLDQLDGGFFGPLIVDEQSRVAVDREIVLVISATATLLDSDGKYLPDINVKTNERIRLRL